MQRGALFNFGVLTEIKLKVKHLNRIINEGNNDDTISSSADESQEGLLQDFDVLEIDTLGKETCPNYYHKKTKRILNFGDRYACVRTNDIITPQRRIRATVVYTRSALATHNYTGIEDEAEARTNRPPSNCDENQEDDVNRVGNSLSVMEFIIAPLTCTDTHAQSITQRERTCTMLAILGVGFKCSNG